MRTGAKQRLLLIMERGFVIHKPRSCARVSDNPAGSSAGLRDPSPGSPPGGKDA